MASIYLPHTHGYTGGSGATAARLRVSCRWRSRAAAAAVRPTTAAYDRGGSMETCEADGGGGGSRTIGGSGGGGRRGDGGCAGFAEAGGLPVDHLGAQLHRGGHCA